MVHEQQDGKNVLLPHSPYRVKFELAVYGSNFSNIERKALGCLVVPNHLEAEMLGCDRMYDHSSPT